MSTVIYAIFLCWHGISGQPCTFVDALPDIPPPTISDCRSKAIEMNLPTAQYMVEHGGTMPDGPTPVYSCMSRTVVPQWSPAG